MALRERVCADDGLDFLKRLITAAQNGEDVSAIAPGIPPQMIERIVARAGSADGEITDEQLAMVRTRLCSMEPGQMRRPGGPPAASGQASNAPQTAPPASGRPSGSGGPPRAAFNPLARGGGGGWRYFANLTHTIELQNEILIAQGVDVLDQLDGDATGAFGFPRHSSRLEAGLFGNGVGFRLSGRYTGETRLDGSDTGGSGDLFFDDLATFDLRIFGNINEITGSQSPALKNLRISLRMDNIFDGQRAVRDANGETPINYQPFVIDPIGRFVGIDIRKLF